MRLVFSGFENPLELEAGEVSVFEIENGALFARVAASLKLGCGRYALEPYSFWDEEREIMPKDALMLISDPLSLPLDDKGFLSVVVKQEALPSYQPHRKLRDCPLYTPLSQTATP